MTVFGSWSGPLSFDVAEQFRSLLRLTIPDAQMFISSEMRPGTEWEPELRRTIRRSDACIVFVTKQNQTARWLIFESAFALAHLPGRVFPFAIDIDRQRLLAPLASLQSVRADRDGTWLLIDRLARISKANLKLVRQRFEFAWPGFEKNFLTAVAHECDAEDVAGKWIYVAKSLDDPGCSWGGRITIVERSEAGKNRIWEIIGVREWEKRPGSDVTPPATFRPAPWRAESLLVAQTIMAFEYFIDLGQENLHGLAMGRIVQWDDRRRPIKMDAELVHLGPSKRSRLTIQRVA